MWRVLAVGDGLAVPDPSVWTQYGPSTVSASLFAGVALYLFKMIMKTLDLERTQNEEYRK